MLFRPPVGSGEIPPAGWYISNPYGNYYELTKGVHAYHTGADLLLQHGSSARQPIYAIANGVVIFARRVPNSTWGNVLVIQHTDETGAHFYSRYGHDDDFLIGEGNSVCVGQMIAHVGNAFGAFAYHLHFDISLTDTLLAHPADWPGLNLERLYRDYIDPIAFLRKQPMATPQDQIKALADQIKTLVDTIVPPAPTGPTIAVTVNDDDTNVRSQPGGAAVAQLGKGTALNVTDANMTTTSNGHSYGWYRIADGVYAGDFIRQDVVSPKA